MFEPWEGTKLAFDELVKENELIEEGPEDGDGDGEPLTRMQGMKRKMMSQSSHVDLMQIGLILMSL